MERLDLIQFYFHLGLKYADIVWVLAVKHRIVISLTSLKWILKDNRLFRRKNFDDIADVIQFIKTQLQGSGALHGYRLMHNMCKEHGLSVRKEDMRLILSMLDPEGTERRRARRRDPIVWHVDSYDKLKPFGICINGSIDGYS
ncbi:hypothetical protein LDENG_00147410 [Lucifuga dentata]|nr:hypothetical protein LDENG_00147410 [Lucifuga dentata]